VRGEIARYLSPGYFAADGSYVGYNVVLPPGAKTQPPIMVGNDCRLAPLSSVGPDVVIGSRVVVETQSELARCVVLDGTYVGRGLEIDGKIVAGRCLVDPESGESIEVADPWILSPLGVAATLGDGLRAVGGWLVALLLLVLQAIPFALLYPLAHAAGGRFARKTVQGMRGKSVRIPEWRRPPQRRRRAVLFEMLGLDLFARLPLVLGARLWLCGHDPLSLPDDERLMRELPHYHPAAVGATDSVSAPPLSGLREIEARYYAGHHTPGGDLRILLAFFWRRLLGPLTRYQPPSAGSDD
jgi:hypothetical protein